MLPGPRIERDRIADRRHIGDVGDAADIDECDRISIAKRRWQATGERGVIGGHERSALPAQFHIVRTHVEDHGNAGLPCQQRAVAQLHGQRRSGPMQHRLTVKADHLGLAPAG